MSKWLQEKLAQLNIGNTQSKEKSVHLSQLKEAWAMIIAAIKLSNLVSKTIGLKDHLSIIMVEQDETLHMHNVPKLKSKQWHIRTMGIRVYGKATVGRQNTLDFLPSDHGANSNMCDWILEENIYKMQPPSLKV
jgi:hypothetical protein